MLTPHSVFKKTQYQQTPPRIAISKPRDNPYAVIEFFWGEYERLQIMIYQKYVLAIGFYFYFLLTTY